MTAADHCYTFTDKDTSMTTLPPDLSPDELDEELVQLVTELSMAPGYQGQIMTINSAEEWEALSPKGKPTSGDT